MKPTEKIKKDDKRAIDAVNAALASTSLERSEGSSSSLFPTLDSKVAYVQALYAHKPRDEETMLPPTRTLTERVKLKKDKQYQRRVNELQVQRQMLEASRAQIVKETESVHAPAKRGPKRLMMREALDQDTRLEAMTAAEVLKEFVVKEERAMKVASMAKRRILDSPRAAAEEEEEEEESSGDEDEDDSSEDEEDDSSEDEDEDEDEEDESSEEEDESEVISLGKRTFTPEGRGSKNHQSHVLNKEIPKRSRKDEEFFRAVEQETGIGMKVPTPLPLPLPPPTDFKSIVKSVAGSISNQEHSLKELKMRQALTLTKLQWANKRPATYDRGSFFPSTAKGRAMKDLCGQMVEEVIDKAWHKILMRPNPMDVAREVQEFKAKHHSVLMGIGRHLVDSIVKDVVDELIVEIASETNNLQKAADYFAFNLLVEAVASSQPDQKHGFHFKGEDVQSRMNKVSQSQEVVLQHKINERRENIGASNQEAEVIRGVRFGSDQEISEADRLVKEREGGSLGDASSGALLDTRSWERTMPDRPKLMVKSTSATTGDGLGDESYAVQHSLDEGISLSDKALYVMGLKGMLEEMKRRRGDAPYGHTQRLFHVEQELTIAWPRGVHFSRARVLAAQRMKPSLAAGAAVWRKREEHKQGMKLAHSAHKRHLRAAGIEASFWQKVVFQPLFSREGRSALTVDPRLGVISNLCPSTNGSFVAVGTSLGAMVVFDLRGDLCSVCFEVLGSGSGMVSGGKKKTAASGKSFWGDSKGAKGKIAPPAPPQASEDNSPIMAFTWSAGSNQIGSLSEQGTLRVWLMKPLEGAVTNDTPSRHPATPFLVAAVGSEMMSSSGKEEIEGDEDLLGLDSQEILRLQQDEEEGEGGKKMMGKGVKAAPPKGRHPSSAAASHFNTNRQTSLTFHRSLTSLGAQPSILIPRPSGDILSFSLPTLGSFALPNPPPTLGGHRSRVTAPRAAPLTRQAIEWILPPKSRSTLLNSQSIYRGHQGKVIFISFLSDNQSLISVDDRGQVALWPALEIERSGFGWYQPKTLWTLPQFIISHRSHGPPSMIWPRNGGGGGGGGGGPVVAVTLFGWMPTKASPSTSSPSVNSPTLGSYESFCRDESIHDDEDEVRRLEGDPQGTYLLSSRTLWLVRYSCPQGMGGGGRLMREEIHAPLPLPPPGTVSKRTGQARKVRGQGSPVIPLVLSSYDSSNGALLQRLKQHSTLQKCDYRVVSASMTPCGRDLILWCRVNGAPRDPDSFPFYSCHVVNIDAKAPKTPRIDVIDHSDGAAPPAYAISPTITGLGSEYMFVGLGWGMVGVFSLATGQMVRELSLATHSPYFTSMQLFTVTDQPGPGGLEVKNAGKVILAAVPFNSTSVILNEINDDLTIGSRPQPPTQLQPASKTSKIK